MRPGMQTGFTFQVNQYGKIVLDKNEEETAYDAMLQLMIDHPRYFLDNLDNLLEFKVGWLSYYSKSYCYNNKRRYAISHPKNSEFIKESSPITEGL